MFVRVHDQPCVVVGGGDIAARKVALLQRAGARVTVVAPALCGALTEQVLALRVAHREGAYCASDLDGAVLVIAATDDQAVNAAVSSDARARRLPVNVVDQPALCTFVIPSIVDRSPLVVAVSTAGAAPVLARRMRSKIEALLPARLGELAALAGSMREAVKQRLPNVAARRAYWERVFEGEPAQHALAGDAASAQQSMRTLLEGNDVVVGMLHVIAAGSGDPDMLSLRALHALQSAALLAYGDGVPDAVLDLARRDASRLHIAGDAFRVVTQLGDCVDRLARGEHVCVVLAGQPFAEADAAKLTAAVRAIGLPHRLIAASVAVIEEEP